MVAGLLDAGAVFNQSINKSICCGPGPGSYLGRGARPDSEDSHSGFHYRVVTDSLSGHEYLWGIVSLGSFEDGRYLSLYACRDYVCNGEHETEVHIVRCTRNEYVDDHSYVLSYVHTMYTCGSRERLDFSPYKHVLLHVYMSLADPAPYIVVCNFVMLISYYWAETCKPKRCMYVCIDVHCVLLPP